MREELLSHQLVQRFLEQFLEGEQFDSYRPVGRRQQTAVPLVSDRVLCRQHGATCVVLGVLPFDKDQLTDPCGGGVYERSIDACAMGPPNPLSIDGFVEVVVGADVLEGEPAPRLDLMHLRCLDDRTEGSDDPVGICHHLAESVRALHLRRQQMVAGPTADPGMPRDSKFGEERKRRIADLR